MTNDGGSDESRFLLRHADVGLRICLQQQRESIDPTCLVSTVQAAGGVGNCLLTH